jgi:type IV pilus assembly protein PilO
MYSLNKREKIIVGAGAFAVVLMCFYVFVYEPKNKEVLTLQEQIKTVDLEIERILGAIQGLGKLEEEVSREQRRVALAKKTTSIEQPVQQLLQQLAGEAERLHMDVISLQSGEGSGSPREISSYKRITMVMNIRCAYRDLGSYLMRLADLPGLFIVDGLEIVRDSQIFPKLQVKLTLSTFVSKSRV